MRRHGAALALAGWYLISPRPLPNSSGGASSPVLVDVDRPARDWKIERSFDAVGKCQAFQSDWIIEEQQRAAKLAKPVAPSVLLELNTRANSRCVASDDVKK